jgi:hypothetical protein
VRGVTIDKKNNTALVTLNTKLYKIDNILSVAQTFTEACQVDVGGVVEGEVQVKLKPKSKNISIKTIGYEFLNYVLAEMKISEDT